MFAYLYEDATGYPYIPSWGADCKIMKDLITAGIDPNRMCELIELYLDCDNNFKGNYNIMSFRKSVNRLQGERNEERPRSQVERYAEKRGINLRAKVSTGDQGIRSSFPCLAVVGGSPISMEDDAF